MGASGDAATNVSTLPNVRSICFVPEIIAACEGDHEFSEEKMKKLNLV
jgi:hypothetical protein